jgi:peptidoglycan-N-acetylglucosamine deacetylase
MSGHTPDRPCPGCALNHRFGRRRFASLLTAGIGVVLAGCADRAMGTVQSRRATGAARATTSTLPAAPEAPIIAGTGTPPVQLGQIPPPHPGPPQVIFGPAVKTPKIAITIDDGYCADCINQYVAFVAGSGIHITFNPNGTFGSLWAPNASILRQLIAMRQVQIGNHTWDHANLLTLSNNAVLDELNRNDDWIQKTFGITSRPWFRPPYGSHDTRVDSLAASIGYTNVVMWNGSYGDSDALSPAQLLSLAQQYLQPGTIMLGHANHPTILSMFPQIQALIAQRGLQPVTLDEMFGTSREVG